MQDMTAIARPALVCNSQSGSHAATLRETIAEHCRPADAQLAATFALPEAHLPAAAALTAAGLDAVLVRSDERRVGKEWVSTSRSRWSPDHLKTKPRTSAM